MKQPLTFVAAFGLLLAPVLGSLSSHDDFQSLVARDADDDVFPGLQSRGEDDGEDEKQPPKQSVASRLHLHRGDAKAAAEKRSVLGLELR